MVTFLEEADRRVEVRVLDAQVWGACRGLCSRVTVKKLRPSESIEEFLRLVLRTGSALSVLNMMQGMAKARIQGLEAYARVLLNWHSNGKQRVSVSEENEVPAEAMFLHALMDVADPKLRRGVQEALMMRPGKQADKISFCGGRACVYGTKHCRWVCCPLPGSSSQ